MKIALCMTSTKFEVFILILTEVTTKILLKQKYILELLLKIIFSAVL